MKSLGLVVLAFLFLCPVVNAEQQIIPAGSVIQCTTTEGRISSKTVEVGDPVLCQISRFNAYGHSVLPYGSYLSGSFDGYSDPGHFVGKGWMLLRFDRLFVAPGTVIPVSTKVVDVPNYIIDNEGKIRGKGHAVRDIVKWSIPILWPIDLIQLPRRGPRPSLRAETRITVKIMEDLEIETPAPIIQAAREPELQRREPVQYYAPIPAPAPAPTVVYVQSAPVVYYQPPPPPPIQVYYNPLQSAYPGFYREYYR